MDMSSRISKMRNRERERLRGPQWLKVYDFISTITLFFHELRRNSRS